MILSFTGIQSSLITYPTFLIVQQLFRLSQKDPYDLESHMPQYKSIKKTNSRKKKDSIEDFFAKLELPETSSELHKENFIEENSDEKQPSTSSLPEKCYQINSWLLINLNNYFWT